MCELFQLPFRGTGLRGQAGKFASTVDKLINRTIQSIQQRDEQIRHWDIIPEPQIMTVPQPKPPPSGDNQRVILIHMSMTVAAAVQDDSLFQQVTVTLA